MLFGLESKHRSSLNTVNIQQERDYYWLVVDGFHRGVSAEAIALSDIRCSIPMAGMVDSFNVSVAAGILMHHAVHDRIARAVSPPFLSEIWHPHECVGRLSFRSLEFTLSFVNW